MTTPEQQEWPTLDDPLDIVRTDGCDRVCPDHNRMCRAGKLHDGEPHACLLCGTQEAPPKE